MSIETSKTEKKREKNKRMKTLNGISKNCRTITKGVTYMYGNIRERRMRKKQRNILSNNY